MATNRGYRSYAAWHFSKSKASVTEPSLNLTSAHWCQYVEPFKTKACDEKSLWSYPCSTSDSKDTNTLKHVGWRCFCLWYGVENSSVRHWSYKLCTNLKERLLAKDWRASRRLTYWMSSPAASTWRVEAWWGKRYRIVQLESMSWFDSSKLGWPSYGLHCRNKKLENKIR